MAGSIPPLERKYVKNKVSLLNGAMMAAESRAEREEEVLRHIQAVEGDPQFQLDPEFPTGLDWFNTPSPLSFSQQLRGKLVVLDFFTYCCINCMHILPDLEQLEERHPADSGGVVVIGVHSAKFGNERVSENIRKAIERYGMTHPVVNDVKIELWERLGVTCWPTLVILSPNCQLLYYIIGEGHGAELQLFMDVAVQYYKDKGQLSHDPITFDLDWRTSAGGRGLWYPGKVCLDNRGERLFIADSSNHRILVVERKSGSVLCEYGSRGRAGTEDGVGQGAKFNTPQGMVFHNETLYVADTSNHLLRKIDLQTHVVSTIAGTGRQGNDKEGGAVGVAQEISSPWDLALGKSPDSAHPDLLYVAMAGTHQIWLHFLQDANWTKGSHYPAGSTLRFSGSGEEANRNNSYPHKASFAQPSGLSLSTDASTLYVADSESSTLRGVALPAGSVKALVGGAIDPLDLFAFGDVDGKGRDVRLQHPLGVASNKANGKLYLVDSYNHKVKVVEPRSKTCSTLAGTGQPGHTNGPFEAAQFSEPGGLCIDSEGKTLFVADSNNHMIRVVDLERREVTRLSLSFPDASLQSASDSSSFQRITRKNAHRMNFDPIAVLNGGVAEMVLKFAPPPGCHWTEDAPSAWQVIPNDAVTVNPAAGSLVERSEVSLSLTPHFPEGGSSLSVEVEAALYFCEESGICHMQGAVFNIPLVQSTSCDSHVTTSLSFIPELPKS